MKMFLKLCIVLKYEVLCRGDNCTKVDRCRNRDALLKCNEIIQVSINREYKMLLQFYQIKIINIRSSKRVFQVQY